MSNADDFLYANLTGSDIRPFHAAIKSALEASGALPEDLADLFSVRVSPVANADGSPRYMIEAA